MRCIFFLLILHLWIAKFEHIIKNFLKGLWVRKSCRTFAADFRQRSFADVF